MELTQQMLDIPIEHMSNVFGKFDAWLKQIEKYLQVTMVVRDGSLKIMGNDNNVQKAQSVMSDLLAMSRKGNDITDRYLCIGNVRMYEKSSTVRGRQ